MSGDEEHNNPFVFFNSANGATESATRGALNHPFGWAVICDKYLSPSQSIHKPLLDLEEEEDKAAENDRDSSVKIE